MLLSYQTTRTFHFVLKRKIVNLFLQLVYNNSNNTLAPVSCFQPFNVQVLSKQHDVHYHCFTHTKPKLRMFKHIFHTLKTKMFPSIEQNSQSCASFPKPCFSQLILIFNFVQCNTGLIQLVTNLKMSN